MLLVSAVHLQAQPSASRGAVRKRKLSVVRRILRRGDHPLPAEARREEVPVRKVCYDVNPTSSVFLS